MNTQTSMQSSVPLPKHDSPPMTSRWRTARWATIVLIAGISIDQASKLWALDTLAYGATVPLFLQTLSLRLALNPGVAFSLGASSGPLLAAGIFVLLVALTGWVTWKIRRRDRPLGVILLSVVAAGGWGNMIDRIFRAHNGFLSGHVVDFIAVDWFAVFNLADVLAVGGISVWILTTLLDRPADRTTATHG